MELNRDDVERIVLTIPGDTAVYNLTDTGLKTLHFSDRIPALSGFSIEEYRSIVCDDAFGIIIEDDRGFVLEALRRCLASGSDVDCIYRILHKEQGYIWIHGISRVIGQMDGGPVLVTTFTSTTLETAAQNAVIDKTSSFIYVCDTTTYKLLYANRQALDRLAGGQRDYCGKTCHELFHDQKGVCPWCGTLKMDDSGHFEEEYHTQDDCYMLAESTRMQWYGRDAFLIKVDDITQRKQDGIKIAHQMEQLRESQHRLQTAIDGAAISVWEYDVKNHRILSPEHSLSHYGMPDVIENVPESLLDLVIEDDREKYLDAYRRIEAGETPVTVDLTGWWGSGTTLIRDRFTYSVVADAEGKPEKAYCVVQDITAQTTMKENYERTLHQFLAVNPQTLCTLRLNLTRNVCEDVYGLSFTSDMSSRVMTVDDLVQKVAALIADPGEKDEFLTKLNRKSLLAAFARGENNVEAHYRRRLGDGKLHWIRTRNAIMQDPATLDVVTAVSVIDDEEEMTRTAIFTHITSEDYDYIAIIFPVENAIRIYYYNPELPTSLSIEQKKHLLGYDFVCDGSAATWVRPDSVEEFQRNRDIGNIMTQLDKSGRYSYEIDTRGQGDDIRRKELSYVYLDSSHERILVMQRDITKLHREQQKRQRELAAQISREQALRDEALHANQMKSEFLSNVSHDMRTPLNAVLGYAYLATNADDCPDDVRGYLQKIDRSGNILLQLINDTLDLNKIETGAIELKPEPTSFRSIVKELGSTLRPLMEAKHIDFEVSFCHCPQSLVYADPVRVNEILLNQLANAVKFTPEGGTVSFMMERISTDGDIAHDRIVISDTGCGMSEEFLPRIFEPFTQERTPETADIEGSGLGLSIVKRLIDMMGGRIEVESELGHGTTFTTYLDLTVVPEGDEKADGDTTDKIDESSLTGRRVLLVEDNAMNSEIAGNILEHHGIKVTAAFDGAQGLATFTKSEPGTFDMILMDIRMPVMDGYAATKAIRALPRPDARTIPIIAMTANAYADDVEECLAAGMDAHISKPIDPDGLIAMIAEHCRS